MDGGMDGKDIYDLHISDKVFGRHGTAHSDGIVMHHDFCGHV